MVYQDTIIGPALREVTEAFGDSLSAVIVLDPSVEVIHRREAARNKSGYVHFSVDDLNEVFQTTPKIGHWLDNSRQSVDETVDAVLDYIRPVR